MIRLSSLRSNCFEYRWGSLDSPHLLWMSDKYNVSYVKNFISIHRSTFSWLRKVSRKPNETLSIWFDCFFFGNFISSLLRTEARQAASPYKIKNGTFFFVCFSGLKPINLRSVSYSYLLLRRKHHKWRSIVLRAWRRPPHNSIWKRKRSRKFEWSSKISGFLDTLFFFPARMLADWHNGRRPSRVADVRRRSVGRPSITTLPASLSVIITWRRYSAARRRPSYRLRCPPAADVVSMTMWNASSTPTRPATSSVKKTEWCPAVASAREEKYLSVFIFVNDVYSRSEFCWVTLGAIEWVYVDRRRSTKVKPRQSS